MARFNLFELFFELFRPPRAPTIGSRSSPLGAVADVDVRVAARPLATTGRNETFRIAWAHPRGRDDVARAPLRARADDVHATAGVDDAVAVVVINPRFIIRQFTPSWAHTHRVPPLWRLRRNTRASSVRRAPRPGTDDGFDPPSRVRDDDAHKKNESSSRARPLVDSRRAVSPRNAPRPPRVRRAIRGESNDRSNETDPIAMHGEWHGDTWARGHTRGRAHTFSTFTIGLNTHIPHHP